MRHRGQPKVAAGTPGMKKLFALGVLVMGLARLVAGEAAPGLKDAVILIIRHAEKPESGKELSPAGFERANAYVGYFETFQADGRPVKLDSLFAASDTENSVRPRLTLEPLSRALHIRLDTRFKDKEPETLARELESKAHGTNILICWRHARLPELAHDLGADPAALLPGGKWPDDVFDWVIELRYDHEGRIIPGQCKRISEGIKLKAAH
jgi:hypothetical protein